MKENLEELLSHLDEPKHSRDLPGKILARIELRERRILTIKIAAFGAFFVISASLTIFGFISLGAQLSQSGFPQFFSLFFSDFSSALANFPDVAFSIAESFPAFSAAFLLGSIAFAVWSAGGVIHEVNRMRSHRFTFK